MHRKHFGTAALVIAPAATALLLSACGAASDPAARAASTTAAATAAATALEPQAQTLESRFVSTVKAVSPSVVEVQTPVGLGSGVVLDGKGDIVTNAHVVGSYTHFEVSDADGKRYSASLVGTFVPDDLAVVHVTGAHLPPLVFGDSSRLQVGDIVLAAGNPLGLQSSVTQGIVSALGRTVTEQNGSALADVIQTSAAINPGNSGGALVDLQGQVVGIPTLAAIDSENSQLASGIGFAIPSNTVKNIATQLVNEGTVNQTDRAYLGVQVGATTSGGVLVTEVDAGGPAATAGITTGDVITSVDGQATPDPATLAEVVAGLKPAQTVAVTVTLPNAASQTVQVTLGQYPG
jgi:putative serine protease PepD